MAKHECIGTTLNTARLFTPAVLLPEQARPSGLQHSTPEHRLLIALLADAIHCFHHAANRRVAREAERWLMNDRSSGPFSFDSVCFFLDLDAHAVRNRLRNRRLTRRAINAIC